MSLVVCNVTIFICHVFRTNFISYILIGYIRLHHLFIITFSSFLENIQCHFWIAVLNCFGYSLVELQISAVPATRVREIGQKVNTKFVFLPFQSNHMFKEHFLIYWHWYLHLDTKFFLIIWINWITFLIFLYWFDILLIDLIVCWFIWFELIIRFKF